MRSATRELPSRARAWSGPSALHAAERVASAGDLPGYCAPAAECGERLVGLAEYETLPGGGTAEISVAVADHWHHRGVGTLLLEHLADAARSAGITAFRADALAENHSVLEVSRDLGLRVVRHFDGPEVHCTVQRAQDENYPSAVDARGRVSDVISNIHNGSFSGRLFAIRPEATAIGPLAMLGLGGTATELLADHAARLAPLTDLDVHDLLTAPRCSPLLFGYAGEPAADVGALEQLLHRLPRMATDLPELAEADLHPVLAGPQGVTVRDARVRLVPRRPHDPYLRRLR